MLLMGSVYDHRTKGVAFIFTYDKLSLLSLFICSLERGVLILFFLLFFYE
jgi:hypothetical protein